MAREAVNRRLPRERRLRKRVDYLRVQSGGEKTQSRHFVVLRCRRADESSRLGITVSKKVGSAVTRNRIKRLVREFVRQRDWLPRGFDVVVIAKRSASSLAGLSAVAADLAGVFDRRVSA